MRAAIYHRVSTLDQNPDTARDELESFAARLGATVALRIEETGSGARGDRPGLQTLLAAAPSVDVVVVWKLDRFGRSALDVLANIRTITGHGARFVACSQGLDVRPGGDAMSQLMLTVLAGVAEFERELIRERTLAGLQRARKKGRVGGRPRRAIDTQAVQGMREQGLSWEAIAQHMAIPESTLRQAMKRS